MVFIEKQFARNDPCAKGIHVGFDQSKLLI